MDFDVEARLRQAVQLARQLMPQSGLVEQKLLATGYLLGVMESVDGFLPGVGAFMDLPVVDGAQKYLLGAAVDYTFNLLQLQEESNEIPVQG